jgi:hypothetical protein
VIPFLGAKELLNVICSCKVLYKGLSTELVVKSVMMGGERMFKKMKQIRDMSENGAIWPMEPIRMLRLVLAVMCEICGVRRVKQPRHGMAISICWLVAQSEGTQGGFTSMVRLFIRIQCFGI